MKLLSTSCPTPAPSSSSTKPPFPPHILTPLSPSCLTIIAIYQLSSFQSNTFTSMASIQQPNFHDFFPLMAEKLGGDGLLAELCNGFRLLMDSEKGVITFDSLKNNSAFLGLQELSDGDLYSMLKEGDFDGDGALNQMEFCVLMFRLSPELMDQSQILLEEALLHEEAFQDFNFSL